MLALLIKVAGFGSVAVIATGSYVLGLQIDNGTVSTVLGVMLTASLALMAWIVRTLATVTVEVRELRDDNKELKARVDKIADKIGII